MMKGTPYTKTKIRIIDSLKFRINALLICIVIIVMGGYASIAYLSHKAEMEKESQYLANITAQRLSKSLKEPMWSLDEEIIDETLASEMLNKQIFAIQIIDRNGKDIFKGYKRGQDWKLTPSLASVKEDNLAVDRVNIIHGDKTIGAVKVYVTDKFLKADFQHSMLVFAVTVGLLIVVIAFSLSKLFQKMVTQPITNLASLADRISFGDLDVKIPVESSNEIGLLAQSFERMQASLKISIRRLTKKK